MGGFKPLTLARYRTGLRGRWSLALVPVEAGQAALEALLGPLSAYEAIVAEQAAPARLEAALADAAPVPLPRPPLVLVPVSVATQRARLALLAQRLDAVRPKPTWGIRQMDWQAHQAAARAAAGLPGTDWQAWRAQARLAAG